MGKMALGRKVRTINYVAHKHLDYLMQNFYPFTYTQLGYITEQNGTMALYQSHLSCKYEM